MCFSLATCRRKGVMLGKIVHRKLTIRIAKDQLMRRGLGHPSRPVAKRPDDAPLSVGELTRRIKALLEGTVGAVAVEGEVSGIKASPSGHIYFALKDSVALVDCVIWRSSAMRMGELPKDGTKIVAKGKLTVYEPRGRYQLVVASLSGEADKGELWRRFEALKEKLAAEGLFDPARKKPLPVSPRTVGIVTSAGGAALRDILKILSRRAPNLRVVVSPCLVQGREAAADIAAAIRRLDEWGGADVAVVARGGGSMEDLWPFNEEAVARAVVAMKTPVVSAVGHEVDFTIAEFVADARAATPSEAAERIAPDQSHLRGRIRHAAMVLSRALAGLVRERRQRLLGVAGRQAFRRPLDLFMPKWQRVDEAYDGLTTEMRSRLAAAGKRLELAETRLAGLSPLAVLSRGYAVVLGPDGKALVRADAVKEGDRISAILHEGKVEAVVTPDQMNNE